MEMISERHKKFIKSIVWVVLILIAVYLFFTKIFRFVAPFIVGLLIALIIEKPVNFLEKRTKFRRGTAVSIMLLLFVIIIGGIITFAFYQLTAELVRMTKDMSGFSNVGEHIKSFIDIGQKFYLKLPDEIVESLKANFGSIAQTVSTWLQGLLKYMLGIIKSLPQVFIFIVISLVSTFFMSRDWKKISEFVFKQIPKGWGIRMRIFKGDLFVALAGFVKAQIILICITFLELFIGYIILGVNYAFLLALLTAILDALPIFGTGTVLIPTAVIHLIMGDIPKAVGFLILYLIITIIRQTIEPRIVGSNVGLHPLVTLMSMYIGTQIFGVIGLILGPIIAVILKTMQKARVLPRWKT